MFVTASVNCLGCHLSSPLELDTIRQTEGTAHSAILHTAASVSSTKLSNLSSLGNSLVSEKSAGVESRTEQRSYRFGMRTGGSLAYVLLLAMLLQQLPSPPPFQHCWPVHKGILSSATQTSALVVSHLLHRVFL